MPAETLGILGSIARDVRVGARNLKDSVIAPFQTAASTLNDVIEKNILDTKLRLCIDKNHKLDAIIHNTAPTFGPTKDIGIALAGKKFVIATLDPTANYPTYVLAHRVNEGEKVNEGQPDMRNTSSVYIMENENISESGNRTEFMEEARIIMANMENIIHHAARTSNYNEDQLQYGTININNGNFKITRDQIWSFILEPQLKNGFILEEIEDWLSQKTMTYDRTERYESLSHAVMLLYEMYRSPRSMLIVEYLVSTALSSTASTKLTYLKACMLGSVLNTFPSLLTSATKEKLIHTIQEALDRGKKNKYMAGAACYIARAKAQKSQDIHIDVDVRCTKRIRSPRDGMKKIIQRAHTAQVDEMDSEEDDDSDNSQPQILIPPVDQLAHKINNNDTL